MLRLSLTPQEGKVRLRDTPGAGRANVIPWGVACQRGMGGVKYRSFTRFEAKKGSSAVAKIC